MIIQLTLASMQIERLSATTAYADTVAPTAYVAQITEPLPSDYATSCNCYEFVATKVPLPHMADIVPNTTPAVGMAAVFYYHGGTVKHVAYITKITQDGFYVAESNFKHCTYDKRFVSWSDPFLAGFFSVIE